MSNADFNTMVFRAQRRRTVWTEQDLGPGFEGQKRLPLPKEAAGDIISKTEYQSSKTLLELHDHQHIDLPAQAITELRDIVSQGPTPAFTALAKRLGASVQGTVDIYTKEPQLLALTLGAAVLAPKLLIVQGLIGATLGFTQKD